jgi:ATP-dependent protease ClpP protease subunit
MDYTWEPNMKRKYINSVNDDNKPAKKRMRVNEPQDHAPNVTSVVRSKNNNIYFFAPVNDNTINSLIIELEKLSNNILDYATKNNCEPQPIYLHIKSYGGSIFSAMAGIDAILNCPVDVNTVISGCAASAGTLLSVVGKKRYMGRHAYMLIHQLSSSFWGKMDEIEDEVVNLKNLMKAIKKIYNEYTEVPSNKLDNILKKDLWWDAEKCLDYKLVDKIWNPNSL